MPRNSHQMARLSKSHKLLQNGNDCRLRMENDKQNAC